MYPQNTDGSKVPIQLLCASLIWIFLVWNSEMLSLAECSRAKRTSQLETSKCPLGYFACEENHAQCVPQQWICNGVQECDSGSDELGCGVSDHEKKYWDLYFPPKSEKDSHEDGNEPNSEANDCKYVFNPAIAETPEAKMTDLNLQTPSQGCLCIWRKIVCTNVYMKNLNFVPTEVEYLDLSGSLIESLDFNFPPSYPRLEELFLSHCTIFEISYGNFYSLKSLKTLDLTGNQLLEIPSSSFFTNEKLEKLLLGHNKILEIKANAFIGLTLLIELDLRSNQLTGNETGVFKNLKNLRLLNLSENQIREIGPSYLKGLKSMEVLSLSNNLISSISPTAFSDLSRLKSLYLSWNRLDVLHDSTFCSLHSLLDLHLAHNRLRVVQNGFSCLFNLQSLSLKNNFLRSSDNNTEILQNLSNLQYVYFDEFWMCGWTLHVRHCEPRGDGISSAQNLLDNFLLRICVWLMGLVGIFGNLFVIVGRFLFREQNLIHSFYIKNLAGADLLFGVFLLSIAFHDIKFRGKFLMFQHSWRNSFTCQLSGMLSTWSSEASVLILALITFDRYLSIARPFAQKSTSMRAALGLVVILWLTSFLLSYLPLSGLFNGYFGHFYGSNGLCLPLQIHNPYDSGWEYSFSLFVLLNSLVFLFIFYSYWKMLKTIRNSALTLRTNQEHQDGILAKRFSLIVLTDFLCWGPIITVKLLAMSGIGIPTTLYAWLAVFVLPINSMLNPIIYTITTKLFKQQQTMTSTTPGSQPGSRRSQANAFVQNQNSDKRHVES